MTRHLLLGLALFGISLGPVVAQSHGPYAGMQSRQIKPCPIRIFQI